MLALFTFERSRKSSAFHGSATTRKRVKLCLFVSMPSSNTFIPYKSAAYLEQMESLLEETDVDKIQSVSQEMLSTLQAAMAALSEGFRLLEEAEG